MPHCNMIHGQLARLGRLGCAVVALTCVGFSGCAPFRASDLDVSHSDDFLSPAGEFRQGRDREITLHAVTNKGMQIGRNLGATD
ncbi:MAG: hypothetical protein HQ567_01055 [Candidatus Nealsonbacteria bacterium]|nr:hypothetical protein [Candidatus Nealsonbacteria bacterium]